MISGNVIREPGTTGIYLANDNYDSIVTGNSIVDPWTNNVGEVGKAVGVYQPSGHNTGTFVGNGVSRARKTATITLSHGFWSRLTGTSMKLGANYNEAPTPVVDQTGQTSATVETSDLAHLGTPPDGTIAYCSNCQPTNPCSASGTGATARRVSGAWICN